MKEDLAIYHSQQRSLSLVNVFKRLKKKKKKKKKDLYEHAIIVNNMII